MSTCYYVRVLYVSSATFYYEFPNTAIYPYSGLFEFAVGYFISIFYTGEDCRPNEQYVGILFNQLRENRLQRFYYLTKEGLANIISTTVKNNYLRQRVNGI